MRVSTADPENDKFHLCGIYLNSGIVNDKDFFFLESNTGHMILYENGMWNIGDPFGFEYSTTDVNDANSAQPPEYAVWNGADSLELHMICEIRNPTSHPSKHPTVKIGC